MGGWLRYLALSAQARTGFSAGIVAWSIVAGVAATAAAIFFCLAAFLWLAQRYDAVTAGLILGFFFLLVALIALVAGLLARRRNIERARLELAARGSADWLDPKLLAVGLQVGQAIGWRRLISFAAVALLAAGLAREWFRSGQTGDDVPPSDG